MLGRKKINERPRGKPPNPMSQFGLLDMPDFDVDNFDVDNDIDDDDLEAELKMLQGGKISKRPARQPKQPLDLDSIQKMAATTIDDDDDDIDVDENDPELLAELEGIVSDDDESEDQKPTSTSCSSSVIPLLEERIQVYQSAVAAAKKVGDSSKARRCGRGLETLQNLLKSAKNGNVIKEEDIPPPIVVSTKAPPLPPRDCSLPETTPPVNLLTDNDSPNNDNVNLPKPLLPQRPVPKPPPITTTPLPTASLPMEQPATLDDEKSVTRSMLVTRRDQYKTAAVKAKQCGDQTTAIKYLKTVKQFDSVISALENGQPIDLSKMPPPPPVISVPASCDSVPSSPPKKIASHPKTEEVLVQSTEEIPTELSEEEAANIMGAPPPPKTVLEALQQRLEKYKKAEESAKAEENNTKARRMNRIVKQYQDAIKANKAGKPFDYAELPTPPGFAPIPGISAKPLPAGPSGTTSVPSQTKSPVAPPVQKPQVQPPSAVKQPPKLVSQPSKRLTISIHEQQLTVLLERHKQFKAAALEAKANGDLQQAKEYLRMAKGFEPMIEASSNGLPVDMSKIPIPPQQQQDFIFVQHHDCLSQTGDRGSTYKQLEKDLIEQVNMCTRNSEYFVRLGDVPSANKFSTYAKHSRKDLEALRNAFKHGDAVPKFHYETRTFSIVQCCAELGDDDLEVVVVRGLNYSLSGYKPSDIYSYVKFEMTFPSDEPKSEKTSTVKGTNNPEYNCSFKLPIKRNSRAFARFVKTKHIKFEVYAKGGWMRSDKLIGSTNVKLAPLETICVLHDSFDLYDNRHPCGGKLEVKLRIREPFSAKQVEEVKEKWLIIDEFVRTSSNKFAPSLQTDSNDEPLYEEDANTFSLVSGMAQIIQTAGILPSPIISDDLDITENEENIQ